MRKEIAIFTSKEMQNNSYLIINDNECVVVDPSFAADEIDEYITKNNLKLLGVLLTHGHYDHFATANFLLEKYNTSLYVYEKERDVILQHNLNDLFNVENFVLPSNIKFFSGKTLELGKIKLDIVYTPGHTIGGICIFWEKYVFTGDTIFIDSVGRMDLPTGNPRQLLQSIQQIKKFDKSLRVLTGHNETNVTLEELLKRNKYVNF